MSFGNKTALFAFCSFLIFIFLVPVARGQNTALRISTIPQYPGPHEDVIVTVEDYSRDLNRTEMTWSVNGTVVKKGTGIKEFETRTGALGSITNVAINIGGNVQTLTLKPSSVDLLWQADTYTAPFYKGKALHSNQDPTMIVAEPFFVNNQGVRLNPDTFIYTWKVDDVVEDAASGYGKKTFELISSILLKPITVSVEVSSADNTFRSAASITILDTSPEVLLYENHPLYGILFNNALNTKNISLQNAEISIVGFPYFFSREQLDTNQVTYDWSLNDTTVQKETNELILRKPASGSGSSSISLTLTNLKRYMQAADSGFDITFTSDTVTNTNGNIF